MHVTYVMYMHVFQHLQMHLVMLWRKLQQFYFNETVERSDPKTRDLFETIESPVAHAFKQD